MAGMGDDAKKTAAEARAARLAEALRENLKRRKSQKKSRKTAEARPTDASTSSKP